MMIAVFFPLSSNSSYCDFETYKTSFNQMISCFQNFNLQRCFAQETVLDVKVYSIPVVLDEMLR